MHDLIDQLLKLGEARDKGIITGVEFNDLKFKLLSENAQDRPVNPISANLSTVAPLEINKPVSHSANVDSTVLRPEPPPESRKSIWNWRPDSDTRQFVGWSAFVAVLVSLLVGGKYLLEVPPIKESEARASVNLSEVPVETDPVKEEIPGSASESKSVEPDSVKEAAEVPAPERYTDAQLITLGAAVLFKDVNDISPEDQKNIYQTLGLVVDEEGRFFSTADSTFPIQPRVTAVDLNNDGARQVLVSFDEPQPLGKNKKFDRVLFVKLKSGTYGRSYFTGEMPKVAVSRHMGLPDLLISQPNNINEIWSFNGSTYVYASSLLPDTNILLNGHLLSDANQSVPVQNIDPEQMDKSKLEKLDPRKRYSNPQELVDAWLTSINNNDLDAYSALYGSEVRYYESGVIRNAAVLSKLQSDFSSWTFRNFRQIGDLQVKQTKDPQIKILTFQIAYNLRGKEGESLGLSSRKLTVKSFPRGLLITGENNDTKK